MKSIYAAALAASLGMPAFAQSSVTLYGTVDAGIVARGHGDGLVAGPGKKYEVANGMGAGGSRFGFKGAEDLGGGLAAFYEIEWGFASDTGNGDKDIASGALQARHVYVGLAGGWGTALVGRVDGARATVTKEFDPFQGAGVANYGTNALGISRANNALAYISPTWNGISVLAAYTNGAVGDELPGNIGDTRIYALIPAFTIGPFTIKYDHEELWVAKTGTPRLKVDVLAASYDFGVAKLFGIVDRVKNETVAAGPLDDLQGYLLGVTAPVFSSGLVKASWVRRDRKNLNDKCDQLGVGYQHNLSKRTYLYADYAQISNKDQGTCQIGLRNEDGAVDFGTGAAGGYGTRGIDLGIVHKF
ncbi:porin [Methylibium sp.]|uniref:porin n=1 Tax=Methylibium sp. TaxID=2067992 RepID=UPI003D1059AC